jgi:Uncharacterized protein conserved in bacteria
MTSGPGRQEGDDDPAEPLASPAPEDRPLSRTGWHQREVETVVPDDLVLDVTHRVAVAPIVSWDTVDDVRLPRRFRLPDAQSDDEDPVAFQEYPRDDYGAVDDRAMFESNLREPDAPFLARDAADAPLESRSLHVELPESVRPGQRFALSAQLRCVPAAMQDEVDLRPFSVPDAGRRVTIDLHVSGELQVLSDATCTLDVLPGRESDPVRFELRAGAPGPASVTLRVFALPADYLGQLRLALPVADAARGEHRAADSDVLRVGAPAERTATLEVDVDAQGRRLSFRLRGPGEIGVQRPVFVSLDSAVEQVALGLQRKLDQVAKGNGLSPKAVETLLRGTGADMWNRLLPGSVKDLLLRNLQHLDALVFVGADDPIPWELLLPATAGWSGEFLADQVLVTRWAFDAASPKRSIGSGATCYVLPDVAPPAAEEEIQQLEALLGQGKRVRTLDALLSELESAAFGLLHFAAHNIVASDLPASAWVKLDQPFQQGMLGADRANAFAATAPLVFMNACNSSAGSPLWVGSTGWAGRFLAAGAGAFLGSLWQVRDGPAKDFAAAFYAQLCTGQTLGAAFQAARRDVAKGGDPTRLGYTLFGNAAATLAAVKGDSR